MGKRNNQLDEQAPLEIMLLDLRVPYFVSYTKAGGDVGVTSRVDHVVRSELIELFNEGDQQTLKRLARGATENTKK